MIILLWRLDDHRRRLNVFYRLANNFGVLLLYILGVRLIDLDDLGCIMRGIMIMRLGLIFLIIFEVISRFSKT